MSDKKSFLYDNMDQNTSSEVWDNKGVVTLNDAICFCTVCLANLAAFALNFNGVRSFLASWSSDCRTEILESDSKFSSMIRPSMRFPQTPVIKLSFTQNKKHPYSMLQFFSFDKYLLNDTFLDIPKLRSLSPQPRPEFTT